MGNVPFELHVDRTVGSDVRIEETYDALKIRALNWGSTVAATIYHM
jgi:hypothetical protein